MKERDLPSILCVDDDPIVLTAQAQFLSRDFQVTTVPSAEDGLVSVELDGPFAVIVTDMNMPGMDGIAFLKRVGEMAPDTTRVLLTGEHDLNVAIQAVNEGNVFRFLTKPCPINVLTATMKMAAEHYRLISAERVALEQTLRRSVKALTDVLALASPVTFGRALRAKKYASELATYFGVADQWQIEVAAMLSQIGCVTLSQATLEKVYHGRNVSELEQEAIDRLPSVARQLFGDIPRMERVVEAIVYQGKCFNGAGQPQDKIRGEAIPWGARVLKIVLDYDVLETEGFTASLAIGTLQGRAGWYDPSILDAFVQLRGNPTPHLVAREISVRELQPGMTFASDLRTRSGVLLIARGQEVTESLTLRLRDSVDPSTIVGPLRVVDEFVPINRMRKSDKAS